MFLSRFPINMARRGAQKLMGSPQAMHAAVMSSFPPASERDHQRVLWRIDKSDEQVWLYVLSPDSPDFTHLVEQAGWPTASREPWQARPYAPLLDRIHDGGVWRFRLRANPVKSALDARGGDGLGRGLVVPHVTVVQQTGWLLARSTRLGFEIAQQEGGADVVVTERDRRSFRRGSGVVTLVTAQFDGVLRVIDAVAFRSALTSGIGRAKAYGCGLMTIVSVD